MSLYQSRLRQRNLKNRAPRSNTRNPRRSNRKPKIGINRALIPSKPIHVFNFQQANTGYTALGGTNWSFSFSPTYIAEGTQENEREMSDLIDVHRVDIICSFNQVINYAATYRVIVVRISELFDYNALLGDLTPFFVAPVTTTNLLTVSFRSKNYQSTLFKVIIDSSFVIDTNGFLSQAYTIKRFTVPKSCVEYKPLNPHGEVHRNGYIFAILTDATPSSSYTALTIGSDTKFTLR